MRMTGEGRVLRDASPLRARGPAWSQGGRQPDAPRGRVCVRARLCRGHIGGSDPSASRPSRPFSPSPPPKRRAPGPDRVLNIQTPAH